MAVLLMSNWTKMCDYVKSGCLCPLVHTCPLFSRRSSWRCCSVSDSGPSDLTFTPRVPFGFLWLEALVCFWLIWMFLSFIISVRLSWRNKDYIKQQSYNVKCIYFDGPWSFVVHGCLMKTYSYSLRSGLNELQMSGQHRLHSSCSETHTLKKYNKTALYCPQSSFRRLWSSVRCE